jgi:uncharacterized phage protein gp47/JayE
MPITLEQIRQPVAEDDALNLWLQLLDEQGFSATSWQPGSVALAIVTVGARLYSGLTYLVSWYSLQGFNDTAEGDGLTAFSSSVYDNQRLAPTSTAGLCELANVSGAPHIVTLTQLEAEDQNLGLKYRNITAGTIPAGGSLVLTFEAESPGSAYNVPNDTIAVLNTPLNGVTISNPDPGSGTWITSEGSDIETDSRLRLRNTTKWGTRTYATPEEGIISFALASTDNISRVAVDDNNPGGPGTTDTYIAGAFGPSSQDDVDTAQAYIDARIPITSVIGHTVIAALANVQPFSGTIHILAALNNPTTQAAVEQALTDYLNGLPIGGVKLEPGGQGYAIRSEWLEAMTAVAGVERVRTDPDDDIPVPEWEILTPGAYTFTYISV